MLQPYSDKGFRCNNFVTVLQNCYKIDYQYVNEQNRLKTG